MGKHLDSKKNFLGLIDNEMLPRAYFPAIGQHPHVMLRGLSKNINIPLHPELSISIFKLATGNLCNW